MRLVLALCIAVGCAMCGRAVAGAARRRADTLRALRNGLRMLKLHMTGMFQPLKPALSATGCQLLERLAAELRPGEGASGAWARLRIRECRPGGLCDALTREDLAALDRLFDGLGESGREAQELLIAEGIAALDMLYDQARTRAAEADRLYTSLGLLTGLTLALIAI